MCPLECTQGLFLEFCMCCSGSIAYVYSEFLLKNAAEPIHVQNMIGYSKGMMEVAGCDAMDIQRVVNELLGDGVYKVESKAVSFQPSRAALVSAVVDKFLKTKADMKRALDYTDETNGAANAIGFFISDLQRDSVQANTPEPLSYDGAGVTEDRLVQSSSLCFPFTQFVCIKHYVLST